MAPIWREKKQLRHISGGKGFTAEDIRKARIAAARMFLRRKVKELREKSPWQYAMWLKKIKEGKIMDSELSKILREKKKLEGD